LDANTYHNKETKAMLTSMKLIKKYQHIIISCMIIQGCILTLLISNY
jgi:hypothetical protein